MKQSRTMSLIEAMTNVVIGYGVAVMTQINLSGLRPAHYVGTEPANGLGIHRGEHGSLVRNSAGVRTAALTQVAPHTTLATAKAISVVLIGPKADQICGHKLQVSLFGLRSHEKSGLARA